MIEIDKEDTEVFSFFHHRGCGGELPCVAVRVLPADRAEQITALDARIQSIRAALPYCICIAAIATIIH